MDVILAVAATLLLAYLYRQAQAIRDLRSDLELDRWQLQQARRDVARLEDRLEPPLPLPGVYRGCHKHREN